MHTLLPGDRCIVVSDAYLWFSTSEHDRATYGHGRRIGALGCGTTVLFVQHAVQFQALVVTPHGDIGWVYVSHLVKALDETR